MPTSTRPCAEIVMEGVILANTLAEIQAVEKMLIFFSTGAVGLEIEFPPSDGIEPNQLDVAQAYQSPLRNWGVPANKFITIF